MDTCVLVSALRSRRGASFRLLSLVGTGSFDICLSVPLVLEYEQTAKRQAKATRLTDAAVDDLLDYLCLVGRPRRIHFLWRPHLRDPKDDHVLELAVEAGCQAIVTHNVRDFAGAGEFGIQVLTPVRFLSGIGALP